MKKIVVILTVTTLSLMILGIYGLRSTQPAHLETHYNNQTLQGEFNRADPNSTIVLKKGIYSLDGFIQLPKANNVTIDASKAIFSGQVTFLSAGNTGMKWVGGIFNGSGDKRLGFTLLHLRNATFKGMTFNNAAPFGNHIFDLLGSTGITFDKLAIYGYGDSKNVAKLIPHSKYAEAIQLDYARKGASGSSVVDYLLMKYGGQFNQSATGKIKVLNSKFLPIMEGNKIISWAQSPIGHHAYINGKQIFNIVFAKNQVSDSVPVNNIFQDKYIGALHFVSIRNLKIFDNTFTTTKAGVRRENWIQIVNNVNSENPANGQGNLRSSNIDISRNKFEGMEPLKGYIILASDIQNENYKIENITISNNVYVNNQLIDHKNLYRIVDAGHQIQNLRIYGDSVFSYDHYQNER